MEVEYVRTINDIHNPFSAVYFTLVILLFFALEIN